MLTYSRTSLNILHLHLFLSYASPFTMSDAQNQNPVTNEPMTEAPATAAPRQHPISQSEAPPYDEIEGPFLMPIAPVPPPSTHLANTAHASQQFLESPTIQPIDQIRTDALIFEHHEPATGSFPDPQEASSQDDYSHFLPSQELGGTHDSLPPITSAYDPGLPSEIPETPQPDRHLGGAGRREGGSGGVGGGGGEEMAVAEVQQLLIFIEDDLKEAQEGLVKVREWIAIRA